MLFLRRIVNLIRGATGQWLGRREHRNPGAVYESAIHERLEQYATLRQAAAGVLYMRSKLAKDLELRSAELRRVNRELEVAVDQDDDVAALALIGRRDTLSADIDRISAELQEITTEAETAKRNLAAFHNDIERLREEKVRMLARFANAQARLRLHETLSGVSLDADLRALDEVREHIERLVNEAHMQREMGGGDLAQRLGSIRASEADAAAQAQLRALKQARRHPLVPMVIPQAVAS
jgi:phage shock protein A